MSDDRERERSGSNSNAGAPRGRKSASNHGLVGRGFGSAERQMQRPSSSSSTTPLSDGARHSASKTSSNDSTSLGKAHKTVGARVASERAASERQNTPKKTTNTVTRPIHSSAGSASRSVLSQGRRSTPGQSPLQVRFTQQKTPSQPRSSLSSTSAKSASPGSRLPVRKSGSVGFPFRKQAQKPAAHPPLAPLSVKTSRPLQPIWQLIDEERERQNKRVLGNDSGGFVRRISSTKNRRKGPTIDANVVQLDIDDPGRTRAQIAPRLKVRVVGELESSDSDSDSDLERHRHDPRSKLPGRKVAGPQVAAKKSAARKVQYVDATSSDSDDDVNMKTSSEEDQLDPEDHKPPLSKISAEELDMDDHDSQTSSPDIILLDTPPRVTIPLPQIKPEPVEEADGPLEPSDELIAAVEALTIHVIRMQASRQLPFLRRTLRKGFLRRCTDLHVPIYSDDKDISFRIVYEYVDGVVFHSEVSKWLCPLCHLFGVFNTREMLNCHLEWDHPEVFIDWEKVEENDMRVSWKLQVLISETHQIGRTLKPVQDEREEADDDDDEEEEEEERENERERRSGTPDTLPTDHHDYQAPVTVKTFSPFPYVSLSPPSTRRSGSGVFLTPTTLFAKQEKLENEPSTTFRAFREPRPSTTPSTSASTNPAASLSRGRSTTGASLTTSTSATTADGRPRDTRLPTPPPADNPLGPAARFPYLPAKSDYGGPTVYYSCRPGGPCLFDLLGTLPMKPYGILEWEIIDREEEIYESDTVKEEYKVMHALWARWIMLHRNKFISNYLEGMISFIDDYWLIIHKAAGWDALRYWLLILLSNQFLSAAEVGKVLIHYENLTGMDSWYE